MLPQIQELANCTDEEKEQLVEAGHACLFNNQLYLSLQAVDTLGMKMVNMNPLVQVANYLQNDLKQTLPVAAEPTVDNAAEAQRLTEQLYSALFHSVRAGIPVYQCFNAFMAAEVGDHLVDYEAILQRWHQHCKQLQMQMQGNSETH